MLHRVVEWVKSVIIACGYDLYVFNKSSYQYKPRVQSVTRDNILVTFIVWFSFKEHNNSETAPLLQEVKAWKRYCVVYIKWRGHAVP
jgi:hypothetical protein